MNRKQTLRITIDLAMTILLLCAYAYRITGDAAHEWIGVSVFVLVIAHNVVNRWWYKSIFRGKYTPRRAIMSAVNIALAFTMTTLFVTGLLQSRAVLGFLHLPGGMVLRLIHTTAAYWLLPLTGVHLGLHWGMFARRISRNRLIITLACICAFLFAAFGVWSSFDRDMFSKLFLGFSFDYWPEERPAILFFAVTLSIMGAYVFITHYVLKGLERKHTREYEKRIDV
jgi:hypothetical protein